MKKSFSLYFAFCLIFTLMIVSTTNSYAENDPILYSLIRELGVGHLSYLNDKPISEIPVGKPIKCWVRDASKLDFFEESEDLVLKKLETGKWELKNPKTGGKFEFSVMYENSLVKVEKISSTQPDLTGISSFNSESPWYIAFKGGVYYPDDDLEDYDTGFYGEFALNRYLSKHFALEAAVGYFETSNSESGTIFIPGVGFLGASVDHDIYVIPLTLSIKGIMPFKVGEGYLGVGVGGYYVDSDLDVKIQGLSSVSDSDDDIILGGQLFGGVNYNITEIILIGLEGKYIFTDEAELHDSDDGFNLNGFLGTGFIGFRF